MIGKITQPLYIKQYTSGVHKQPSFGSNYRSYYTIPNLKDPYTRECMETTTCLLRSDLSWNALIKFLENHFQKAKKVQVLNPACSDGSEAYSLIMLLKERVRANANKFFPIYACDVDNEILKAANSKLLQTTLKDRYRIQAFIKDYSKYLTTTDEQISIQNDRMFMETKTLKATNELTNAVKFHRNDLFNMLRAHNDNSNTFLMCRNVLGHLEEDKVKKFAKLAGEKLDTRSVIAIGDFDKEHTKIYKYLEENNFERVLRNVFVKIDDKI